MDDVLLGGLFVLVAVAGVGYWWRRSPRQSRVFATGFGLFLVGMLVCFEAVERLTAGAPTWVTGVGILANGSLWVGVLGPLTWGRFERRFPIR